MKENYNANKLAKIYIREIVWLYGVPVSIVSDRGIQFTSGFWSTIQWGLDTQLDLRITFNPQTGSLSERIIQVLEDMLRACVMEFRGH